MKASNILPQPKAQAVLAMDQPCSMGVQLLQRDQRKWRFNLQASKGTVQEMLPQQLSPIQVVQWPLEKHLMTAQIVPKPSQHRQD
jgi:hypothetical protein